LALPLRGGLHLGRLTGLLLFGVLGTGVLVGLGVWQVQRLGWKQDVIALIETRLESGVADLPAAPNESANEYAAVRLSGTIEPGEIHVLLARNGISYRVIAPFLLADGRRVMLDRGIVPDAGKDASRPIGPAEVEGNLLWPDETDSFTPDPNLERNIWFARDVGRMSAALGTEPVLVVARRLSLPGTDPLPVSVELRNNHLEYAITWFAMAITWSVMTAYLLWRIKRRID
jgi:surfeit locus 1 family protein